MAAAVALLMAAAAPGDRPAEMGADTITFLYDLPDGEVFCRGLVIGENAITARHCVRDAFEAGARPVYLRYRSQVTRLERDALDRMATAAFAAQSASFTIDFNAFSLPALAAPTPLPGLPEAVRLPRPGEKVLLQGGAGGGTSCTVQSVCGASFFYSCQATPQPGWSGSPVWSAGRPRRLLGVHAGEGSGRLSRAVTAAAVLGRSSALFESGEAFSSTVARNRAFAHRWQPGCETSNPATSSRSTLGVDTPVRTGGMLHGMTVLPGGRLLAADIARPGTSLCLLWPRGGRAAWSCTPNPAPTANRVNVIEQAPGGMLAFGEARLTGHHAKPSDSPEHVAGGVSIVSVRVAGDRVEAAYRERIVSPIGGVYTLRRMGRDLVAGGDDGVCVISDAAGPCQRICAADACTASDPWRVNGLLPLGPDRLLAVGSDHRGSSVVPAFKVYERERDGWRQAAIGYLGAVVREATAALANRRTGLQLKAPVLVRGRTVVFGSDGAAYLVDGARITTRIPIVNTWRVEGVDTRRDTLEDAVRDAVVLPNGMLAVASSDGCVRLLRLEMSNGALALRADQDLTVFDRGLWMTELALSGTDLYARSQDGAVTRIDVARVAAN